MRRTLVWTAAAGAVLFAASSAWAPPPAGGGGRRPPVRVRPPVGGIRPVVPHRDIKAEFDSIRSRSPADAAKYLRESGARLPRSDRAALLNVVAYQLLRQQQAAPLADLRQLRADWSAVGPGAGLDPAVELELAAAESAAEYAALARALGHVDAKRYADAAADLAPLAAARHLPAAVVREIPGLTADLRRVTNLAGLGTAAGLPSAEVVATLPGSVKRAVARVETVLAVRKLVVEVSPPELAPGWSVEGAGRWLDAIARDFGPDAARRSRVDLSVAAFLAGKPDDGIALLDGEIDPDHARRLLGELRLLVLGNNTIPNPIVPTEGPLGPNDPKFLDGAMVWPAGVTPLVPRGGNWRYPKPVGGPEFPFRNLENRARRELAAEVAAEVQVQAAKVSEAAARIRAGLAKRNEATAAFRAGVQARLGRGIESPAGVEFVAALALRGLTVDDAVSLLTADADRPARVARVVGAAFGPAFVAHAAVACRPPASLKPGEQGGFRLPAAELARDRDRVREAVRAATASLARLKHDRGLPVRPAFEAAVVKELGVPAGESPAADELVLAVLEIGRESTAALAPLNEEVRVLAAALREVDETDLDDPEDRAAVREAKDRLKDAADAAVVLESGVRVACRVLGDYGPTAAPAVAWLSDLSGTPCDEEATSAVRRITGK